MDPQERWTDSRNDALDRLVTPDPPDYAYPVECPKCLGAGCILNDQYDLQPYSECPRCRGRGSVAA